MTRLLALLLAFVVLVVSQPVSAHFLQKDDKKVEKKDDKKEEKKDDKLTPAQEKALKDLTGTWVIVTYEREGKKEPDARVKKMKVVQDGAKWRFFDAEDITLGEDTVYPEKTPMEVDSKYLNGSAMGKTAKGIYKIEGDTVTFCHADPDLPRPTTFSSGKEKSGLTLWVMKKEKTEEKKDDKKEEKKDDKKEEKKDDKKEEKKDD